MRQERAVNRGFIAHLVPGCQSVFSWIAGRTINSLILSYVGYGYKIQCILESHDPPLAVGIQYTAPPWADIVPVGDYPTAHLGSLAKFQVKKMAG